jgi:hypothetical protein
MQSNEAICATNMTPERSQQVKEIFHPLAPTRGSLLNPISEVREADDR